MTLLAPTLTAPVYDQVTANKRRSWLLVAGFVVFVALIAAIFTYLIGYGGPAGFVIALLFAGGSSFLAYWKSDSVALAVSRAKPATIEEYPRLHNLVEGLCIASGLPKPRLYVVDDPAPNAFATGRNPRHAAVAVTTGLLEKLNRIELEGVLAHELSHIKNYDILVSTLAVTMVGVVAVLADLGIRMTWWGMGRNSHRDFDNRQGGNGGPLAFLAIGGFVLPAGPAVGPREAARRLDRGPRHQQGHRPPLDRGAGGADPAGGADVAVQPPVRHPPAHRGPHRPVARDVGPAFCLRWCA